MPWNGWYPDDATTRGPHRDFSRLGDAYPVVMSSPPTLTMGLSGGATAITPGTDYLITTDVVNLSPRFTYIARHFIFSGTYSQRVNMTSPGTEGTTRVEWVTDAPNFEVIIRNTGWPYQLRVDGLLVDANGMRTDLNSGDNAQWRLTVDFSGVVKVRRFTLEGPNIMFRGVRVPAIYGMWPSKVGGPKLLVIGDSYVSGSALPSTPLGAVPPGGATPYAYAYHLGCLLGMPNTVQSGVASTGVVFTNSGTRQNYLGRVATDIVPENPDCVLIHGSVNDYTSLTTVGAATAALIAALRVALPNAIVVACSPVNTVVSNDAAAASVSAAMSGACIAAGAGFVDLSSRFNGTGRVGTTTGDGNRDRYLGTDAVHISVEGNKFLASTLAAELSPYLAGTRLA